MFLDVEEAAIVRYQHILYDGRDSLDIVSRNMDNSEQQHGKRHLPMEPYCFVKRHPSNSRPNVFQDVPTHGQHYQRCIE